MKIFKVDRTKWRRGEGDGEGHLLDGAGCGCIMGLYALACGAPADELVGEKTFYYYSQANPPWQQGAKFDFSILHEAFRPTENCSSELCLDAMEKNDLSEEYIGNSFYPITDATREKRLIKLFASIGIELEFFN